MLRGAAWFSPGFSPGRTEPAGGTWPTPTAPRTPCLSRRTHPDSRAPPVPAKRFLSLPGSMVLSRVQAAGPAHVPVATCQPASEESPLPRFQTCGFSTGGARPWVSSSLLRLSPSPSFLNESWLAERSKWGIEDGTGTCAQEGGSRAANWSASASASSTFAATSAPAKCSTAGPSLRVLALCFPRARNEAFTASGCESNRILTSRSNFAPPAT